MNPENPAQAGRTSRLLSLTPERCRELLARGEVGRVGWNSADGPHVLPVNYAVSAGEIVFRTSPYGLLAQLVNRQYVAFEIDEIDRVDRTGWSIEVRGHAEGLKPSPRLLELFRSDAVVPWAEGSRTLYICITPTSITGRYVEGPMTTLPDRH